MNDFFDQYLNINKMIKPLKRGDTVIPGRCAIIVPF